MTEAQLPAGPEGDDRNRLPARQDDHSRQALAIPRGGGALSLDLLDDRRQDDSDEIDLLAYWRILAKRRWLVLGILAGTVALALLATLMATPVYRATTVLQLSF